MNTVTDPMTLPAVIVPITKEVVEMKRSVGYRIGTYSSKEYTSVTVNSEEECNEKLELYRKNKPDIAGYDYLARANRCGLYTLNANNKDRIVTLSHSPDYVSYGPVKVQKFLTGPEKGSAAYPEVMKALDLFDDAYMTLMTELTQHIHSVRSGQVRSVGSLGPIQGYLATNYIGLGTFSNYLIRATIVMDGLTNTEKSMVDMAIYNTRVADARTNIDNITNMHDQFEIDFANHSKLVGQLEEINNLFKQANSNKEYGLDALNKNPVNVISIKNVRSNHIAHQNAHATIDKVLSQVKSKNILDQMQMTMVITQMSSIKQNLEALTQALSDYDAAVAAKLTDDQIAAEAAERREQEIVANEQRLNDEQARAKLEASQRELAAVNSAAGLSFGDDVSPLVYISVSIVVILIVLGGGFAVYKYKTRSKTE